MQPSSIFSNSNKPKYLLRILCLCLGLIIAASLIYELIASMKFHVVNTNPSTGNIATVSPFFKINFNEELKKDSASVSTNPIIRSYFIQDKTLVINLNGPLVAGRAYSIKIKNISDINRTNITNKVFAFVPVYISPQNLPKDQQQALLKKQTARSPSKNNISFGGTNALINNGLTSSQLNSLEQYFFEYKPTAHKVIVNSGSVQPGPHNPNVDTSFTLNFYVSIDNATYKAVVQYSNLTSVQLTLYNPQTNALVFNSTDVTNPGGD